MKKIFRKISDVLKKLKFKKTFKPSNKEKSKLEIEILEPYVGEVPVYKTEGSAGFDLSAQIQEDVWSLAPGERALIPLGVKINIPQGFEIQLRPRSGLALTRGLTILNSPGTIDSDYKKQIKAIIINLSLEQQSIYKGERICQAILAKVERPDSLLFAPIKGGNRGGFGSTK